MMVGMESAESTLTVRTIELHPQFVTRVDFASAGHAHVAARDEKGAIVLTLTGATSSTIDAPGASDTALIHSRIHETAARNDEMLASDYSAVASAMDIANGELSESELQLLQAELMEVAPSAAVNTKELRADFSGNRSQTAMLAAEYETLRSTRTDAIAAIVDAVIRNPELTLSAFEQQERAYRTALVGIRARAEQQAELNMLMTRRLKQACDASGSSPVPASTQTTLEQMDVALAAMRSTPAPESTRTAVAKADAVDSAKLTLPASTRVVHAALSSDAEAGTPPMARTRSEDHVNATDAVTRPEKMAVLRSSADELAEAESDGVIRMAQQTEGVTEVTGARPATPVNGKADTSGPRRYSVPKTTGTRPAFNLYNPGMTPAEDPLRQLVNIDFRDMELSNVVSLLAQKGQINVIAGTEVEGTVTANLKNIPLGRAIEIVLRMNGLGIVEEAGVYRITTYEEAISSQRETRMIFLENAQAEEVKKTLDDILAGRADGELVAVSANPSTNVILVAGPLEAVEELEGVVAQLDVAEPVIPTLTLPIKLNYSEPLQMLPVIQPMMSEELGAVTADPRSRHLIVTDTPVKVQEIQSLITSLDLPVKQVSIDAMIVDAEMEDDAATGVDWILNTVHSQDEFGGTPDFSLGSALPITNPQVGAATMAFGIVSDSINLRAEIQARVESTDSKLLANPTIVTVENQPATINIAEEIPYQELTQTSEGGQIASTEFKDVGTVLTVTPRVTHDNHILVTVDAKQSNTTGVSATGVPIESKREAQTTLRVEDGQSIFIGGLRAFDDELANRKVPILGDIPVLNTFFKSQDVAKRHSELLIFLTCNVLPDQNYPELTPYQKEKFDELGGLPHSVDGTRALVRTYTHPQEMRDPIYKWRRSK
jgi:type II secretory pathway component HofQ